MKKRSVLISLIFILLSAAFVSAQDVSIHTRGHMFYHLLPSTPSAQNGAPTTANISAFAGQTITIRIQATSGAQLQLSGNLTIASETLLSQVPCDSNDVLASAPTASAAQTKWTYDKVGQLTSVPLRTERAWKGTCRLLSIKLNNGTEYRARIQFR